MKRALTLTSAIMGTVFQGILALESIIFFIAMMDLVAGASGAGTLAIVMIITIAIAVLGLLFNILSIPAWNKAPEVFRKKRGIIITAIVFNLLVVVLSLIGFAGEGTSVSFLSILMLLCLIAASIMYIVDLATEKKKVAELEAQNATEEVTEETAQASTATALEEKLVKLNQMKEQGIIDEEEYNELKKKYISEML